jgi:hypothetical protein
MSGKIQFLSYKKAREVVRKLGLKSKKEYNRYSKKQKINSGIPSNPPRTYSNSGWVSWMDYLGTKNRRPWERKYKVNDDYFKKWSHNMAYILGFWFADGNMFSPHKNISFDQHTRDAYILENIKKEIGAENPVRIDETDSRLCISSGIMVQDIKNLGGMDKKSLIMSFPSIPEKYLPDFVRGLWDGDGCISYHKKYKVFHSNYISGSKKFVVELHRLLKENIPNLMGCFMRSAKNAYRLKFATNDTIRLRNFMYQGPLKNKLMLKRKYDKFSKTSEFCSCEFLEYAEAEKFVKTLGIKNRAEWSKYCKSKTRNINIPRRPDAAYKNNGWKSWGEWFGTGYVYKKDFLSFQKARNVARKLGLKYRSHWRQYVKDNNIKRMPLYPDDTYSGKGWISWYDFLNKKKGEKQ